MNKSDYMYIKLNCGNLYQRELFLDLWQEWALALSGTVKVKSMLSLVFSQSDS